MWGCVGEATETRKSNFGAFDSTEKRKFSPISNKKKYQVSDFIRSEVTA